SFAMRFVGENVRKFGSKFCGAVGYIRRVKFSHLLRAVVLSVFVSCLAPVLVARASNRTEMDLSGLGWRLWLDKDAKWESDELFLPPVDVAKLPVNAPTGGWESLAGGRKVSVPGTV